MTATSFVCDDRSGRYDRGADLLLADWLASAKACDIGLMSEMTGRARQAAIRKIPGFTVHQDTAHGDASEIAALTKDAVWRTLHDEAAVIGPDLGPGGREIAGILVLEDVVTGARMLVSKAHLPATVQRVWDSARAAAYRACVQRWRKRVNELAKKFGVAAQLVWADWNLDLHQAWVRKWIAKAWPELRLPTVIPRGGTHGDRLIDWFIHTGIDIESWTLLPRSDASDHRGSRLAASIPAPKERRMTAAAVIAIEKSQLGYREGRDASGWNNDQKFSDELPGFKWSDKQPWCATFQCWGFWKADMLGLIPAPSASCDLLAAGFKKAGQWSTTPRVGSLGFLGSPSDLVHVFLVTRFDNTYVYTIEGNTNDVGAREGYEVAERKRLRSSVVGYAHPRYPAAPARVKTVNITDFLQATTRKDKRAALERVVEHGAPAAKAAAKKWLDADDVAAAVKSAARKALIALEVK